MTFYQFYAIQYTILAFCYDAKTIPEHCVKLLFLILFVAFSWLATKEFEDKDKASSEEKRNNESA